MRLPKNKQRRAISRPLLPLTLLEDDDLVSVAHTLALVRLRLALGAKDSGEVPNLNLVVARHSDLRVAVALHLDALGDLDDDRVSVAEGKVDGLAALHRRLVADADELELLLKASRHTHHHVVGQGPVETVTLPGPPGLVSLGECDLVITLSNDHGFGELHLKLALGTLHAEVVVLEGVGDALGDRHRVLADAGLLRENGDGRGARARGEARGGRVALTRAERRRHHVGG